MVDEYQVGVTMNWPTWTSIGEAANNEMPTWGDLFNGASAQIEFQIQLTSALSKGMDQRAAEAEAKRQTMAKMGAK